MEPKSLIDPIIGRFKTLSLERLETIETSWILLTAASETSAQMVVEICRQVHTLKGDSRVMGFADVNLLSQKFEDLLLFARQRNFRVSEELTMVGTMALQFMGMLLRKKAGAALGGLDLGGFVKELDETIKSARCVPSLSPIAESLELRTRDLGQAGGDRLSAATRQRLAVKLTQLFLESLRASGATAQRLHQLWLRLVKEISALEAVPLEPYLAKHVAATSELAKDLGKRAELTFRVSGVRAAVDVVEALDVALLHAVRNAVDHGIETADQRHAAEKREVGSIEIRAQQEGDSILVWIEDDGRGVDLEKVRQKGIEQKLLPEDRAAAASEAELLELLFIPAFSTRAEATSVSGRGIGLDAVRAALANVEGTVSLQTRQGRGMLMEIQVPQVSRRIEVWQFASQDEEILLAAPSSWSVVEEANAAQRPIDLLEILKVRSKQSSSHRSRTLLLRNGSAELRVLSGIPPTLTVVERALPTPPEFPLEVVRCAGGDGLLLRPDQLVTSEGRGQVLSASGFHPPSGNGWAQISPNDRFP